MYEKLPDQVLGLLRNNVVLVLDFKQTEKRKNYNVTGIVLINLHLVGQRVVLSDHSHNWRIHVKDRSSLTENEAQS